VGEAGRDMANPPAGTRRQPWKTTGRAICIEDRGVAWIVHTER
jgi:hypothetical protein